MGLTSSMTCLRGREVPIHVPLAGIDRANVTTSHGHDDIGVLGIASVSFFGLSAEMSMPASAMAVTTAGLSATSGADPAEWTTTLSRPVGRAVLPPLRTTSIVDAEEEDLGTNLAHLVTTSTSFE